MSKDENEYLLLWHSFVNNVIRNMWSKTTSDQLTSISCVKLSKARCKFAFIPKIGKKHYSFFFIIIFKSCLPVGDSLVIFIDASKILCGIA